MTDQCPNKNDIQLVFKRLRSATSNKTCFDCNAKNPTWASVTYGVFICIDCSAVHRGLGVHLTFVRSTQLDTNWTWLQLRQMQLGGNANASVFFRQHNCTTTDAQQKYNSRAAQLYREKLHGAAIQAMRIHGTKLHIEALAEVQPNEEPKEEDFFVEHTVEQPSSFGDKISLENEDLFSKISTVTNNNANMRQGAPSVDAILSPSSDQPPSQERKSTIGVRRPQAKRTTLGGKKGGLGAQKVKTNFAEIELEAAMADQLKLEAAEEAKQNAEKEAEEAEKQNASLRLAYKEFSQKQQKEEEKIKQVDPKKAEQVERLGMGFVSRTGVSHSVLSDMKMIEQESPNRSKIGGGSSSNKSAFDRDDSFFEDFSVFGMYKSGSNDRNLESMFLEGNTSRDRYGSSSKSSWEPESKQPSFSSFSSEDRTSSRRNESSSAVEASGDEAQKKFGSAKAISSDQYFGVSGDNNWERKANLSRFEGSSSISSADYFGNGSAGRSNAGGGGGGGGSGGMSIQLQGPDLEDVKESVRQGVTKVAGKLSSLANGVMSSIQDRYGYY